MRCRCRSSRSIRSGPRRCRTTGSSDRRLVSASTRRIRSGSFIAGMTPAIWTEPSLRIRLAGPGGRRRGRPRSGAKAVTTSRATHVSECCDPAPPVVAFDQAGNVVYSWGGPDDASRLAGVESRHHRRPEGHRLDRRQRRPRLAHHEVHARGQVRRRCSARRARAWSTASPSPTATTWTRFGRVAKIFIDPKANEALRR